MNAAKSTIRATFCSLALLLAGNFCAVAEESDEWKFELSPLFLWGISLHGSSTIGTETVPLDINFKDNIFTNLAGVLTAHFEARKGRWGGFAEIQYVDLEPSAKINNLLSADISIINKLGELGGVYRFYGEPRHGVEVLAGVRGYGVDLGVSLDPGPQIASINESWADGFVGARVFWGLSPKWTFIGRADVGGGPIGQSNFVWNVAAIFDYRFNDLVSAFVGYRALGVDYETGSGSNHFEWDIIQQGPLAAVNFYW